MSSCAGVFVNETLKHNNIMIRTVFMNTNPILLVHDIKLLINCEKYLFFFAQLIVNLKMPKTVGYIKFMIRMYAIVCCSETTC